MKGLLAVQGLHGLGEVLFNFSNHFLEFLNLVVGARWTGTGRSGARVPCTAPTDGGTESQSNTVSPNKPIA